MLVLIFIALCLLSNVLQSAATASDVTLTTETMLYQANEHFIDSFYGDFWADWQDDKAGLCLSIHQAHQNFPKRLLVDRQGVIAGLYPYYAWILSGGVAAAT